MTKNKISAPRPQNIGFRDWLSSGIQRIAVVHFCLLIAYGLQIIVLDAWHVIVPDVVMQRWVAGSVLLAAISVVWFLAHNNNNDIPTYKRLLFGIVLSDIAFAAFNVYVQRGMASKAVLLFAIPIISSAILLNRAALFSVAAISTSAYIAATVSYFVLHFNEGYKTELYGEVGFYCATFFALAALLSAIIRFGGNTNNN